jgi:hypothetical protein
VPGQSGNDPHFDRVEPLQPHKQEKDDIVATKTSKDSESRSGDKGSKANAETAKSDTKSAAKSGAKSGGKKSK